MTGEYTFVTAERQNELTRRIQDKLSEAAKKIEARPAGTVSPLPCAVEFPPRLATTVPATTVLQ